MGIPNRDEAKGKVKQATGTAKEKAGDWTDDEDLEAEGKAEHAEGDIQEKYGKAKRKVGEAIEDAGENLKRS